MSGGELILDTDGQCPAHKILNPSESQREFLFHSDHGYISAERNFFPVVILVVVVVEDLVMVFIFYFFGSAED